MLPSASLGRAEIRDQGVSHGRDDREQDECGKKAEAQREGGAGLNRAGVLVGGVVMGSTDVFGQSFEGSGQRCARGQGTVDGARYGSARWFGVQESPRVLRIRAEGEAVGDLGQQITHGSMDRGSDGGQGLLGWAAGSQATGQKFDGQRKIGGDSGSAAFGGRGFQTGQQARDDDVPDDCGE
jgi:hypothetical protein